MRVIYTERVLNRLQQFVTEIEHASELNYHNRLKAFKDYCENTRALAYCLAQLPQAPPCNCFEFDWTRMAEQWPGDERDYAMQWNFISQIVDRGPNGVLIVWNKLIKVAHPNARDGITELLVRPLQNYLDHQLQASSTMLYILLRYTRWAEWFEAERLRKIYDSDSEAGLDRDLRRFLFESGIDYPLSEPRSPGGRADIVAELDTDDPLVLEVKVWDSSKDYKKNRIRDGLRQVMDYAAKYRKDKGYVVVFNLDPEPLEFVSPTDTSEWPPRIEYGSRTYYFIAVDIAEQQEPVSQRDKGKPVKTNRVLLAELLEQLKEG